MNEMDTISVNITDKVTKIWTLLEYKCNSHVESAGVPRK